MMERKVFLDTDFLCSFLWIGRTNYLAKVLPGYEVIVPYQTASEIKRPLKGLIPLQAKYHAAKSNGDFIEADDFDTGSSEYKDYLCLTHGLGYPKAIGSGEAAGIVLAKKHHGVLASNNLRDIADFVEHFGIALITTCDILLALYDQCFLNEKELSKVFSDMLKQGRQLPFPTFSALLQAREDGTFIQRPIP